MLFVPKVAPEGPMELMTTSKNWQKKRRRLRERRGYLFISSSFPYVVLAISAFTRGIKHNLFADGLAELSILQSARLESKNMKVSPSRSGSYSMPRYASPSPTLYASSGTATAAAAAATTKTAVDLRHTEFPMDKGASYMHPPVILLHGLLGSKRNFASLGTSLAKQLQKKRRVLAVDLRNHGDNHHDWRDDMSYTSMAEDIVNLLDQLGIPDAVLVGHSMGGKVAQAAALLCPERVSGLVILDIAPVRYDEERDGSWQAVKEIIDMLCDIELSPSKTKKQVDTDLKDAGLRDPALRAFVLTNLDGRKGSKMDLTWKIDLQSIARELDVLAGFDISNEDDGREMRYGGDTFFIHGGASRFIRHAHMQTIAHYFPNHMLTTVRGAGHWVHAEAPDDTLALIKRYLDR